MADPGRLCADVGPQPGRAPALQVGRGVRRPPGGLRLPLPPRPHPQPAQERPSRRLCAADSLHHVAGQRAQHERGAKKVKK